MEGVPVHASPLNDSKALTFPPGGLGPIPAQCNRVVPSGAVIKENEGVVLPNGSKISFPRCVWETHVTNRTGWVSIHPIPGARYYLLTARYVDPALEGDPARAPPGTGRAFEVVSVGANQTTFVTLKIPPANLPMQNPPSSAPLKSKVEPILYVRVLSSSGEGLGGISVIPTPLNSTGDLVSCGPFCGGSTLKECVHLLPLGAVLVDDTKAYVLPNGTKVTYPECPIKTYITNSTGWVTVYRSVIAKYYNVGVLYPGQFPTCCHASGTIRVQPDQTQIVTFRIGEGWKGVMPQHTIAMVTEGSSVRWNPSNITVKLGGSKLVSISLWIMNNDPTFPHRFKLALPGYEHMGGITCEGKNILPHTRCWEFFDVGKEGKYPFLIDPKPDERIDERLAAHPEEVGWLIVEP